MKFLFYSGGFENKENEKSDTRELLATNRALSLSIDSLEQRCKLVEIKNKKMKQYKNGRICESRKAEKSPQKNKDDSKKVFSDLTQRCR